MKIKVSKNLMHIFVEQTIYFWMVYNVVQKTLNLGREKELSGEVFIFWPST